MAFAFKKRWSDAFKREIEVVIVADQEDILFSETKCVRDDVRRKFAEKNIRVEVNGRVSEISPHGVHLEDGRFIKCNVPIWATGAEP